MTARIYDDGIDANDYVQMSNRREERRYKTMK